MPGPPVPKTDAAFRPVAQVDDEPVLAEPVEPVEPAIAPADVSIPVRGLEHGGQRPRRARPSINPQVHAAGLALVGLSISAIVGGVIVLLYFSFLYDPSVPVDLPDFGWGGHGHASTRVVNLGRMQDRQIGIWVGIALAAAGLVTTLFGMSLWARSFERSRSRDV